MEGVAFPPPINKTIVLSPVATTLITIQEDPWATIWMQPAQVTSMIKPIMKLQQSLQLITTNITSSCQRKG